MIRKTAGGFTLVTAIIGLWAAIAAPGFALEKTKTDKPPVAAAPVKREEFKLAKLSPIESPDKVTAALAQQPAHTIKADKAPLAELRFAVAGDQLAVHAKVTDSKIARATPLWEGASLEVFGSLPDTKKIGQVFLVPQANDKPAIGLHQKGQPGWSEGKIEPEPRIRLDSTPTAGGYELRALIPLALLAVDGNQGKLLLEFLVTITGADGKPQYVTLFGSKRAYEWNDSYGSFQLQ